MCSTSGQQHIVSLTHFLQQLVSIYTPWKYQPTRGFLFLRGHRKRPVPRNGFWTGIYTVGINKAPIYWKKLNHVVLLIENNCIIHWYKRDSYKNIHLRRTCCSNCVCNDDFPLDIRRRLNVHNVLWTFYVRSIYIFHTGDHFWFIQKRDT